MNSSQAGPRAIIFDCDGTLANTMPLHWLAWQNTVRRYQLNFSRERFYSMGGVPSREIVRMLSQEQGLGLDHLAVAREREEEYLRLIPQAEPIEAVVNVARKNHGRIPLAVASGGTRRMAEGVLQHLGIRNLFDAVVTSEDVTKHKPAPDIFLEAARRLGVPPAACLGYEDTDLGLQAIHAAGMAAVDVRVLLNATEAKPSRPAR